MSGKEDILLFGLGGVGSVYAYILNESPNAQVTVCARSNYKNVSEQGLDFQSEKYGNHPNYKFHHAVATPSDPSLKGVDFKYVVATHKGIQTTPSAAEQLKPVIGKDTVIVLIQNGVGVEEPFKAMYPNNTILSGVTWVNANQPQTGTIVHKFNETMQFGAHFNSAIDRKLEEQRLNHFVELLQQGGTDVELVPSIDVWRWKKTIWNATWNTLTALTLARTDQLLAASDSGPIVARRIIAEMASIARALGHEIEDEYLVSLIERDQIKNGIYSSMCMDACFHRPMEVETIVSLPLRKAKELGLETPTLETINALVCALDWRFRNNVPPPAGPK
ncbi:putative ketopantoate reductase family protein [Cystobasidium minutum MCA 4210]|uniref:putative ketopantoate reductase family protein n=1 Tax=Cystobasidium minutum MCA 4210 TaxID=1397322 RepID=UPI0034CF2631|eukprot:jgi/Rhomi1/93282/CE93281_224